MSTVLAVLEQRDGALRGVSGEVASAAASLAGEMGGEAEAILLGGPRLEGKAAGFDSHGLSRVREGIHEALSEPRPEALAAMLTQVLRELGSDVVLFPATSSGRDLAPRVAALLGVPLVQDVTAVYVEEGSLRLVRPVYAGKAFSTVEVDASPVLATLRPGAFPAEPTGRGAEVDPVAVDPSGGPWPTRTLSFEPGNAEIPDVSEATIVVSGGRGLRDPSNWSLLDDLRSALGPEAGLGASRAVVDAGWRPHSEQVGQTGKTVAPRLYFAIGISGAVQHLAGMRTSRTIVAVNRDKDAPIFRVADYGIVGDALEVVPRLTQALRSLRED